MAVTSAGQRRAAEVASLLRHGFTEGDHATVTRSFDCPTPAPLVGRSGQSSFSAKPMCAVAWRMRSRISSRRFRAHAGIDLFQRACPGMSIQKLSGVPPQSQPRTRNAVIGLGVPDEPVPDMDLEHGSTLYGWRSATQSSDRHSSRREKWPSAAVAAGWQGVPMIVM